MGLAFFSISAFWLMYDNIVPKMLENTFGLGETLTGLIMAMDNILAVVLLPVFGAISDKAGKRIPFIVGGTIASVALTLLLPLLDQPGYLITFLAVLGALLLAMSVYRSPAVALMPDVTPKPLRSRGNAVINLMGSFGGIYTLIMSMVAIQKIENSNRENYLWLFVSIAVLMAVSVLILALTVPEKKLKAEMIAINYGVEEEEPDPATASAKPAALPPAVRRSLILILISVFLWFMGYNAVSTAYTRYAQNIWGLSTGSASLCLIIAQGGALITYIPIGMLSAKLGRKKTILIGVATLVAGLLVATLMGQNFSALLYVVFAFVGFAWAAINVNSFPMVVEISHTGDIGKYTGYYYTFSMAAQIVTPVLSGALIEWVESKFGTVAGYSTVFPYAIFFIILSFITMCFVRHGDAKPAAPASKLEAFAAED